MPSRNNCFYHIEEDATDCKGVERLLGEGGVLHHVCGHHLREKNGFFIEKSGQNNGDSGLGLFTTKSYKKEEPVVEYIGKVLSKEETGRVARNNPRRAYFSIVKNEHDEWSHTVDASNPRNSSIGRFVNDCKTNPNLESYTPSYVDNVNPTYNVYYAAKDIHATEGKPVELLVDYDAGEENLGNDPEE
jgi:SET domain-containing protein